MKYTSLCLDNLTSSFFIREIFNCKLQRSESQTVIRLPRTRPLSTPSLIVRGSLAMNALAPVQSVQIGSSRLVGETGTESTQCRHSMKYGCNIRKYNNQTSTPIASSHCILAPIFHYDKNIF